MIVKIQLEPLFADDHFVVDAAVDGDTNVEDRHARQIADAIKSAGSSIAFAIWMGLVYAGCMISLHH